MRLPKLEVGFLSATIAGAILLRILPQLDKVFVDGQVWFREVDTWYHMRLADVAVRNFPHILQYDWFNLYPMGMAVGYRPLLTYMFALPGAMGLDYEVFAAFLPPILGGLTIIPTFFLARELFPKSRFIPIFTAFLVGFMPGEFLHRSLLGFTDHHVLEVLFTASSIMFLVIAIRRNWKWAIGGGVSLGFLALSWYGTALVVFAIGIWFLIDFFIKTKRGEDTLKLAKITSIAGAIGFAVSAPIYLIKIDGWQVSAVSLLAIAASPWLLTLLRKHITDFKVLLGVVITIIVGASLTLAPQMLGYTIPRLFKSVFWGWSMIVSEGMPATPQIFLSSFGVAFFLAMFGLFFYIKERGNLLFAVWSIVMLAATIAQQRWGYYLTVSVAVLASFAVYFTSHWVAPRARAFAIVIVCLFTILPSARAIQGVSNLPNNITPDWYDTLVWMRDNTPEPFESQCNEYEVTWDKGENMATEIVRSGTPQPYEAYYMINPPTRPTYTVMAWWDYGNGVVRIGHRVVTANPMMQAWGHHGFPPTSIYYSTGANMQFFGARTLEEANDAMRLVNGKYAIIDYDLLTSKFYAISFSSLHEVTEENSIIWKIWREEIPEYKLVCRSETVRVYEWLGE